MHRRRVLMNRLHQAGGTAKAGEVPNTTVWRLRSAATEDAVPSGATGPPAPSETSLGSKGLLVAFVQDAKLTRRVNALI